MFSYIDEFLNRITMYKLLAYFLCTLLVIAMVFGYFGLLPYTPLAIAFATAVLLVVALITNKIFSLVVKVQTNVESAYITALILALIITPPAAGHLFSTLPFLICAAALAMASKYILAIRNKHLFNPAALAVVITAFTINQSATWWIGNSTMLFFVALGGFLVVRKIQREAMIYAFLAAALLTSVALSYGSVSPLTTIYRAVVISPLIFFAAIMITEPLTTPPERMGQVAYGMLVGVMFSPQAHIGSFYFTPELALVIGNIFSYAISPKGRYIMTLVKTEAVGSGIYNFRFTPDRPVSFKPGQYMEWTLGHAHTDSRGNRRYFTIASSPTEREVILGIRFYDKPSSFKAKMLQMQPGDTIMASQLAGDFTLPKDRSKKLVFMAGGIGVTPFRSMLKYLADKKEQRDVITVYATATEDEIAYIDVFEEVAKTLGSKTICTLTNQTNIDPQWQGYRGYISAKLITEQISDYAERSFYISGSHTMVKGSVDVLHSLGIRDSQIHTDFFPGLV